MGVDIGSLAPWAQRQALQKLAAQEREPQFRGLCRELEGMLGRVFTKLGGTIPTVSSTAFADDGDVAGWAKSEVAFMSGKDIVKGVGDNKFAPTKTLSIQEAVIMANRMLETLK